MWCGSWMDVDGGGVWFEDGVDREGVRSWMGVYGEWRMDDVILIVRTSRLIHI